MRKKIIVVIIAVLLTLSSCSFPTSQSPTFSPSPTSSATPTPVVTATPTPSPSPTPEVVELTVCGYVMLTDSSASLNLRDGPNTSGAVIDSLPNGTRVEILEEYENWYKVKFGDEVGYVSRLYVGNVESLALSSVTSASTATPDNSKTAWINVNSLSIRAQPGTDSEKIGEIPYGESVQGSCDGDWMCTTYNGVKGYIYTGEAGSGRTCVVYSSSALVALPTTAPSVKANDAGATYVYITKTGSKYHRGSCGYLHSSSIKVTLEYAISHGYTPCSRCNP